MTHPSIQVIRWIAQHRQRSRRSYGDTRQRLARLLGCTPRELLRLTNPLRTRRPSARLLRALERVAGIRWPAAGASRQLEFTVKREERAA